MPHRQPPVNRRGRALAYLFFCARLAALDPAFAALLLAIFLEAGARP